MARAAHYRCYFLDSAGSIHSSATVEAAGEAKAIDIAVGMWRERRHCHGIELWQGGRRLYVDIREPSPAHEFTMRVTSRVPPAQG